MVKIYRLHPREFPNIGLISTDNSIGADAATFNIDEFDVFMTVDLIKIAQRWNIGRRHHRSRYDV